MPEIKAESSKCIRCDDEKQTFGPVDERDYKTLHYASGEYLLICNDCWDEVEDRTFA